MARYVIDPGALADRVAKAVLKVVQGRMPTPADCRNLPEFIDGDTLGPGTAHTPA